MKTKTALDVCSTNLILVQPLGYEFKNRIPQRFQFYFNFINSSTLRYRPSSQHGEKPHLSRVLVFFLSSFEYNHRKKKN